MAVTIQDVKVIATQPGGSHLIIVKVITSEPGLYGLGCATFTQRWHAVVAAIDGGEMLRRVGIAVKGGILIVAFNLAGNWPATASPIR